MKGINYFVDLGGQRRIILKRNIPEEYCEAVHRAKYKICVQNIAAKHEEHKLLCRRRHRRENIFKINLR